MQIDQYPNQHDYCQLAQNANVIPVCREILADTETPVSLLQHFCNQSDPVFLFESVEGGERWGRYSFLGVSAKRHIRVMARTVEIEDENHTESIAHEGQPLAVLRQWMQQFKGADLPNLPRFWGGLVGYLAYEMVSFFEAIPNRLPADQPLAHFIMPDVLLIFDNVQNTLRVVVITFPESAEDAISCYLAAQQRIDDLLASLELRRPMPPSAVGADLRLTAVKDPEDFCGQVERVKQYIREGDIIQAVIAQPFVCETCPDPWLLYRAQRYVNPSPYLFFLRMDDTVLVGSSPETMVRLESGCATLRPIAGTRPRGKTEQMDRRLADELLADEKERAEHLMLVDLGRNDLGRVAETGTVQVNELMTVERYSHVMHLVSNITCDLKPTCDAWDLIAASFPAGTLSGAPKVRAMEIIDEMEGTSRGAYGGAVGYISYAGNMDLAITIRTACLQDGKLTVHAGAGIVADSDPESENQETINKSGAINRALQLLAASSGRSEEISK